MKISKKNAKISNYTSKQKLSIACISICVILAFIFGINSGLQNNHDPYYQYLDSLLSANGFKDSLKLTEAQNEKYQLISLSDRLDTIKRIYNSLQTGSSYTEDFDDYIIKPFIPSWEYKKLLYFLDPLIKSRHIVISGVTGSGKTTLVERISKLISGSDVRILQLQCVEQMGVEYHKVWVGYNTDNRFVEGRLLKFFKKCNANPDNKFVFILDDFDKIYPSTFFGSELWSEMDNPDTKNIINGYSEINIPENFYLISITHIGVANVIELNNEHYRRLGDKFALNPDVNEFLLGIKERIADKKLNIPYAHIKKLLFFFKEANDYIAQNYGMSYTLGQWATIRKKITPEEWDTFINEFITHVNSFKPENELKFSDFESIFYTIENNGLIKDSYFFYKIYSGLVKIGMFSELTVAIVFALFSGLFGWIFIVRKREFINNYQYGILEIVEKLKRHEINHEEAIREIYIKKGILEKLILKRKIKYEESTFLLMYINDQIREIELFNNVETVSADFMKMLEEFMQDGVLDQDEYLILVKFLDNIRSALTPEVYYSLKKKVDSLKDRN